MDDRHFTDFHIAGFTYYYGVEYRLMFIPKNKFGFWCGFVKEMININRRK